MKPMPGAELILSQEAGIQMVQAICASKTPAIVLDPDGRLFEETASIKRDQGFWPYQVAKDRLWFHPLKRLAKLSDRAWLPRAVHVVLESHPPASGEPCYQAAESKDAWVLGALILGLARYRYGDASFARCAWLLGQPRCLLHLWGLNLELGLNDPHFLEALRKFEELTQVALKRAMAHMERRLELLEDVSTTRPTPQRPSVLYVQEPELAMVRAALLSLGDTGLFDLFLPGVHKLRSLAPLGRWVAQAQAGVRKVVMSASSVPRLGVLSPGTSWLQGITQIHATTPVDVSDLSAFAEQESLRQHLRRFPRDTHITIDRGLAHCRARS